MTKFVQTPNLPENPVAEAIIGHRYKSALETALRRLNINVLWLSDNKQVDIRLAGHADLSVAHIGGDRFIAAKGQIEALHMADGKLLTAEKEQGRKYPLDCALNACIAGEKLICNPAVTDPGILAAFASERIVPVKQGYARCGVCVVDKDAIITADRGVAASAVKSGIKTLRISPDGIELDGYASGFIGGASFKISSDLLAFTGRLDRHPDFNLIESFCASRNVRIIYLTDMAAFDIGSAVLVKEYF